MEQNGRANDKALFRYALIREAADPSLSHAERGALVRALAQREHVGPDGRSMRIGRSTLDDWIRAWRKGGFEALVDRPRVVPLRTCAEVLDLAERLKREQPDRSAVQVHAVMQAAGHRPPHVRTLQRHFTRLGLAVPGTAGAQKVYGRFEASSPNELWTGDALHGPQVGGKKAYLLAFIDDHSRLLCGYRWCVAEDSVRLESALRAGLASRGVPKQILVDRGSAFVASPLLRACAVLGIRLIHASPRAAATKGKIERFFRTVRSQFLVELEARGGARDLAEVNSLFSAWVEVVYHRRTHSETKKTPLERFFSRGSPALPVPALLHEAFLWSEWRTVTKTCCVSLHGNRFEVDAALCGRRVELVFDPFDLTDIEVRFEHRPMGKAVPVKVGRHTHPMARPEAQPPVTPTGIDYLALVARQRDKELGSAPIGYAALSGEHARPAHEEE
ncbi:MAG: DDE-type integrase/transposase/recombinase [Actinomycetota bacterium]|jgi:putative transposase|nr:DDE-type integrase/transposase/recombinase [Actinomycetota bacterium]MDA8317374.1 DDE-type integrase/transposase/recombinase [Actinomycetota bacterium]